MGIRTKKKGHRDRQGQVILEFTFCMIVVVMLIFALVMTFKWSSVDLANRRIAHDDTLITNIDENWTNPANGPLRQLNPDFFESENELDILITPEPE